MAVPPTPAAALDRPRVLFLIHRYPPAFGGGPRLFRQLRDTLLKEGSDSIVLTGNRWIPGGIQRGVHRLPSPGGERFPRFDSYSFALMAAPILPALRGKFDLIHTIGNAHYVYLGILAGRLLNRPVLVSSIQNREDDPGAILRERFSRIKNRVFLRASAYVCCSGMQMEVYRKCGYPMERVHFIPNGVDPERFRPCEGREEKARLREKLGLSRDEFSVVSVGAVCDRKGSDLLVDAWIRLRAPLRRGMLLLIGPSAPGEAGAEIDVAFVQSLRDRLARAGLSDTVRFTGSVANVEDYLRAADVFALMSRGEGFPVAILEAMDSGLPFVIWDLPDYSGYDLREGEEGFLVPPFDLERLAACLAELESSPDRVDSLGRAARRAASRFTLQSTLSHYLALYGEIDRRHRAGTVSPSPAGPAASP
jgi:glycosyltransferase involved in cell wall biosynthesis